MSNIANHFRVPDTPQELRDRVLNAARKQFVAPARKDRRLLLSWAFAVTLLSLFLIFWNPPIPLSATEISRNPSRFGSDPLLKRLYERNSVKPIAQTKEMRLLLQENL